MNVKQCSFFSISVCLIYAVLVFFQTGCKTDRVSADLILKNGHIITLNSSNAIVNAVAVKDGRIFRTGSDKDIEEYTGSDTKVIDLKGQTVVPGLIDAHGHVLGLGKFLNNIDLKGTLSYQEVVELVRKKAETVPEGSWILGRGWDQNDWENTDFPHHTLLSEAVPNHPVWLTRIDGHAGLANAKAMELADVGRETRAPAGGKLYSDEQGELTGVFVDNAEALIYDVIPGLTEKEKADLLTAAGQHCASVGLTMVGDAGIPADQIVLYKQLIDEGKLAVRVYAMLDQPKPDVDVHAYFSDNRILNTGDFMFSVRSVKLYMDGALGSRGAAMIQPYSDDPGNTGLVTIEKSVALDICRIALEEGFQVCTHAIGDKGNRLILDVYENALEGSETDDHRFRVEHAQILSPEDIPRFSKLGVIPSMQPTHATSDMYWAEERVGPDRIKGAYAWRSLMNSGSKIPCGSDFPIESNNPLLGIYAAVTRQDVKGYPEGGWYPEEKMTRLEALKGFTVWAAESMFLEEHKGSIEEGKLADFTVLSKDIMTIEPSEMLNTQVVYTIVGGKIVYKK